ncbi:hypothetical protein [Janthinobacterium fluminis]|uniref:Phage tail protein (Tail_P2_I) n=1 Tax=Janthinobacterium fluminis TaxID=2987524 RepID=A0ABT5JY77_9BURK|nr:hypothetical protein [Janthinobacterium fluminis]MDC8757001.1 hypothetical protein [Janthinobacterium fluminis]
MNRNPDRLYELLPLVQRMRDAEQGYPLKALLAVIAGQATVLESDIARLYDNWFIETCDDWVAPYIGDLIGYRTVNAARASGPAGGAQARGLNKAVFPRREIANTLAARRRKGTLALLELLAGDGAGWPARAVEFFSLLGWTQHLNHRRLERGGTVNLRRGAALDLIGGPFDVQAHNVDVRRIASTRTPGRHNIPSVGLFVWRLKTYPLTQARANCLEDVGAHCFTFNVLGHDTPLYNRPLPEASASQIAGELNLPVPLRRRALEFRPPSSGLPPQASPDIYGAQRSLLIMVAWQKKAEMVAVPAEQVVAADLSSWRYKVAAGQVALDPQLGRIMFPQRRVPKRVWVSYRYAFSADMGGGEYPRPLSQPKGAALFRVGHGEKLDSINAALQAWHDLREADPLARAAVIEIVDSGVYSEQLAVTLGAGESLQIRAGQRPLRPDGDTTGWTRPVLRLLDYLPDQADAFSVRGKAGSRLVLDGLLISGRGIQVYGGRDYGAEGAAEADPAEAADDLCDVTIRHCTLVPGWGLECDCEPQRPNEPSLEIIDSRAAFKIEHSIVGTIRVSASEVLGDPARIAISDSIVDATGLALAAIEGDEGGIAFASLSLSRSTVLGSVAAHALELAENSIFMGPLQLARRQTGCLRFCYVSPASRTPRRFHCEPDLRAAAVDEAMPGAPAAERDAEKRREAARVRPLFTSMRYGTPAYCQLARDCAAEIRQGADDESEMGAFHDLFQPQREANLRARLDEYTPASMDVGIIFAN